MNKIILHAILFCFLIICGCTQEVEPMPKPEPPPQPRTVVMKPSMDEDALDMIRSIIKTPSSVKYIDGRLTERTHIVEFDYDNLQGGTLRGVYIEELPFNYDNTYITIDFNEHPMVYYKVVDNVMVWWGWKLDKISKKHATPGSGVNPGEYIYGSGVECIRGWQAKDHMEEAIEKIIER